MVNNKILDFAKTIIVLWEKENWDKASIAKHAHYVRDERSLNTVSLNYNDQKILIFAMLGEICDLI